MTLIRKAATAEAKILDEAQGIVEAYVNSMGVIDWDGEIIAPSAFDASIAARLPSVAWFHDQSAVVGKVTAARNDGNRLLATMQFNLATQRGREAYADVAGGYVGEWSVGFYSLADHVEQRDGKSVRVIDAVDWVEVSVVMRGASPNTRTIGAKEQLAAIHERLQDVSEAEAVAAVQKERSYESIRRAIEAMLNPGKDGPFAPVGRSYAWVVETYPMHVIVCREDAEGSAYWQIAYTVDPATDDVTLGEAIAVEQTYVPVSRSLVLDATASFLTLYQALDRIPAPATSPDAAGTVDARALLTLRRLQLQAAGVRAEPATAKAGARNSAADARRIQAVHDAAVQLGATCAPEE